MHFGENQLSRSLIGLSPLPTGHPPSFQPRWVRSSTRSYPRFNLPMGRSPRFGSRTRDSHALFRLAFATATPHGLTSPRTLTRRLILQKARRHPTKKAPTDCRHTVSGTISLPSRGTFHHSLTVLIRYRSPGSIQAYHVVVADSHGISRAPSYSGTLIWRPPHFAYGGLTHYARPSQTLRLRNDFLTPRPPNSKGTQHPTTPGMQRLPAITHTRFSLLRFRSPLLTEYLLLRVLRCFTSPRSPPPNSPRHIAGYNVLLRLLVPRHPPYALTNLNNNKTLQKMLTPTIQFSNNPPHQPHHTQQQNQPAQTNKPHKACCPTPQQCALAPQRSTHSTHTHPAPTHNRQEHTRHTQAPTQEKTSP